MTERRGGKDLFNEGPRRVMQAGNTPANSAFNTHLRLSFKTRATTRMTSHKHARNKHGKRRIARQTAHGAGKSARCALAHPPPRPCFASSLLLCYLLGETRRGRAKKLASFRRERLSQPLDPSLFSSQAYKWGTE